LLNDPYHKDWKAYADGEQLEIKKANGAMMAVHVAAGKTKIVFLRRPGLRFFWISTVPAFVLMMLILINVALWAFRLMRSESQTT
jgi:uncharacterized membrane protein YfhO